MTVYPPKRKVVCPRCRFLVRVVAYYHIRTPTAKSSDHSAEAAFLPWNREYNFLKITNKKNEFCICFQRKQTLGINHITFSLGRKRERWKVYDRIKVTWLIDPLINMNLFLLICREIVNLKICSFKKRKKDFIVVFKKFLDAR